MQVLKEDQQLINRFSKLNLRYKELDLEIAQMKVLPTHLSGFTIALVEATDM